MLLDNNDNHIAIRYIAAALDGKGSVAARFDESVEGRLSDGLAALINEEGVHKDATLDLPPGSYALRVIVIDTLHGKTGSASHPVIIE
jgi:hypothetical protein